MEWAVHVFDFIMMHRLSSFHLIGFDLGGMAWYIALFALTRSIVCNWLFYCVAEMMFI